MEYCWIRSCKNYRTRVNNLDLYPLPANPDERALWEQAFNLTKDEIKAETRICGFHFRRKYFLDSKPSTNLTVNGSGPLMVVNNPRVTLHRQSISGGKFLPNNNAVASNNPSYYMAFQDNQDPGTYILHIPEVNNTNNLHSPSSPHDIYPVSNKIMPPNVSHDVYPVSNKVVSPNVTFTDLTSEKRSSRIIRSAIVDSCELFCQEEKLTPEQEKFHYDEWLNYVKFTANIQNLPNISVASAAEVGENVPSGLKSPKEFPVLVYSNGMPQQQSVFLPSPISQPSVLLPPTNVSSVPQPQTLFLPPALPQPPPLLVPPAMPQPRPVFVPPGVPQPICVTPVASSISNTSVLYQISSVSSQLSAVSPTVTQCTIPAAIPVQSPIFPVKLEKTSEVTSEKLPPSHSQDEEIFPLVLQDGATESLLNTVKEASLPSNPLSPTCELIKFDGQNTNEKRTNSPAQSVSSENGHCMSPDLLSHVEVSIEENETESLPASLTVENTSASLGSEAASDETNGPKIVDIISGDAGASELFKSAIPLDSDSEIVKEKDKSSESNGVLPENSMPKTVTQWSIFSMQKTIAVISSGSVEATVRNLLGVRLHIPPVTPERDIATHLKNRLREENFLTLSAWWMIQKQYLPLNPPCTSCGGKVFRINSCFEYLDGLCWVCDNKKCRKVYPVKRPKFFERFPSFTLEELLLLTYHWACKSRIWIINYDVPVHAERVWAYFTALQELCGCSISSSCSMGKGTKMHTVEVSAVKLGKFFILCAYDRRTKLSRLQALTTEEACGSISHIKILEEWLGNNVTLITWKKISDEFLPNVNKVSADPGISHVQSPGRHILNASKYLGKTMVQLFQNICHDQLTLETVQNVLNEVQWRERHGQTEESAFWAIMNEITKLNDSYSYTEAVLGEIGRDRYFYKADVAFRLRWGPYEIGAKTSSAYSTADRSIITQKAISQSVDASTNKALKSNVSTSASVSKAYADIQNSKTQPLHPISIVSVNTNSIAKDKSPADSGITPQDLLSIKMYFVSGNVFNDLQRQAEKLGMQLKEEGYLLNPVRWLINKKYIKDEMPCYVCHFLSQLIESSKYEDGVSWICQKPVCRFENKYKRPSFFAHFGFKLDVIFSVIFHWAMQTDYQVLIKAVPLNEFNIISIHRQLQKVCTEVVKGPSFKIGGKKNLVEVAFVKFANCFILGAMERSSKHSRFRTFSNQIKLNIDEIRRSLISWLWEDSTVIVNSNKYLGRYCMEERINLVFADQSITDITSKKYHTLTITNYLQNHMKTMFRTVKVQHMSADLLQIYLDELVWRERYGRTPLNAFHSIMRCIFNLENGDLSVQSFNSDMSPLENAASYYGFSLPLPEAKVVIKRLSERVIDSYTSHNSYMDDVRIIDDFELTKDIKEEIISDDEVEIINLVPESKSVSSLSLSSSSSSSDQNCPVQSVITQSSTTQSSTLQNSTTQSSSLSEIIPAPIKLNKSDFFVNKHDVGNKRYALKCYSHRKKIGNFSDGKKALSIYTPPVPAVKPFSLSDGKSRCMECKTLVSPDHFLKLYTCGDCKCYIYSTYCQKAFARHRSYILFGRAINSDEPRYNSSIILSEKWFCSCGFSSQEGNKLASHLIECKKTTCYLKSNNSVTIIL